AGLLPEGSRGAGAVGGALQGASMGAALGPLGMAVGGAAGLVTGLIGAGKRKRAEEKAYKDALMKKSDAYGRQFNANLDTNNENPYGAVEFAFGGDVDPVKKNAAGPGVNLVKNSLNKDAFLDGKLRVKKAIVSMGHWENEINHTN